MALMVLNYVLLRTRSRRMPSLYTLYVSRMRPSGSRPVRSFLKRGGADFAPGPYAASKVAQVLKKLMSRGGGGGGDSDTFFLLLLKNVGSIFQTRGRGIFVHHQPL